MSEDEKPAPAKVPSDLAQAIAAAKAEARAAGLTDADIDAELAATNAERRGTLPVAPGEGARLAAEFRALRRGQRLNGLKLKDLITEGRLGEPSDDA